VSFVTIVFISCALQCSIGACTWSSWVSIVWVQFCILICQLVVVVCLMFVEDTLNTTELLWLCAHALVCVCVCARMHAHVVGMPDGGLGEGKIASVYAMRAAPCSLHVGTSCR
jgi:hypothetical protein